MNGILLMPRSPPVYSNHCVQPVYVGNSAVCQFACLGGTAALSQTDMKYHGFIVRENSTQSKLSACPMEDRPLSSSQVDCQRPVVMKSDGAICVNNGSSSPCLTYLVDAHADDTRKPARKQSWVSNELSLDDNNFAPVEGTHLQQQLPFQLYFYYSQRLQSAQSVGLRRNDSCAVINPKTQFDDDISTVSSTDEFDAVACGAASNETFAKYIPLLNTCPPRVPKILLNKRNRNEWKDYTESVHTE